ncbi:MAG TPA: tryptophan-rich sensory protein [Nocardiopsis listeri]|uniref:TspO/MBR family protein n=1 Tax=Nocardiopsis listeri TaxID=53440 RepID=UPI001D6D1241|nr:TspO/MBR family protein [Nocardiopsis listeri]HJE58629.1 tryptophan-rich sensory protein [Nocardiopsis listeri]
MERRTESEPTTIGSVVGAVCFAAAVLATALVGGTAAAGSGDVYAALELPAWAPPAWLFGPVWTALYIVIAVAGWLVWRAAGADGSALFLTLYAVQLLLNAAWTPLFFGFGLVGLALVDISMLAVVVALTTWAARRHSRVAMWLFVPYLVWVLFATALTLAIRLLN